MEVQSITVGRNYRLNPDRAQSINSGLELGTIGVIVFRIVPTTKTEMYRGDTVGGLEFIDSFKTENDI
jgi:hypothetical protein